MTLVDWNIQWGCGVDGQVDLGRIVRDARALCDFDVLCLQEITRGFHEEPAAGGLTGTPSSDQFAELAALLPEMTVLDAIGSDLPSLGTNRHRRQFGNAIVTRLPVRQVLRHSLPWPADPAKPSVLRVALEAVLETDIGPLRVISTHLEFHSEKQWLEQVARLRNLHQEACDHARSPARAEKPDSPFADTARPISAILCGDFNQRIRRHCLLPDARTGQRGLGVCRRLGLRASWRAARCHGRTIRSRAMARRTIRMRFRFRHARPDCTNFIVRCRSTQSLVRSSADVAGIGLTEKRLVLRSTAE